MDGIDILTLEGRKVKRGSGKGQVVGILTSGGDAQGGLSRD